MAQLFPESFGVLFRAGFIAVVLLGAAAILVWRAGMAYPAGENVALEQPVPFSHKHHVGDAGIDCRYCHTSVETSAFAGMPPLSTCMTCHSQLYTDQAALAPLIAAYAANVPFHWQRLNTLPDFVYFNHSIHIQKGVACDSCHGHIEAMPLTARAAPLTMQWCLDCHRAAVNHAQPAKQVSRLTECSVCHR